MKRRETLGPIIIHSIKFLFKCESQFKITSGTQNLRRLDTERSTLKTFLDKDQIKKKKKKSKSRILQEMESKSDQII